MRGERDESLNIADRALSMLRDLGIPRMGPLVGDIYEWFGETEAAIADYQRAVSDFQAMGERGYLSTVATELAHLLLDVEQVDEAREALRTGEEASAADDIVTQVELRAGRARVMARTGDLTEAERLAREAVMEGDATDYLLLFTRSRIALADVLRLRGAAEAARETLEEAAAAEERRGNLPYAATIRRRAERLA